MFYSQNKKKCTPLKDIVCFPEGGIGAMKLTRILWLEANGLTLEVIKMKSKFCSNKNSSWSLDNLHKPLLEANCILNL